MNPPQSLPATSSAASEPPVDAICLRGVRTHNLQNLDVDLPYGKLIVITGVSGSGKSSLAFDTLFAEGQRRFLECQSPAIRRRLAQLPRPSVDAIDGLPPTLSVAQRRGGSSRRATLATLTELHDFFRLLFARAGTLFCPACHTPVSPRTPESIVDELLLLPERTKLMLLAPLVRHQKGTHADILERIAKKGYVRARVDGELTDVTATLKLAKTKPHDLDAVIDRLILKEGLRARLNESLLAAIHEGNGCCIAAVETDGVWRDRLFSTRSACLSCGTSYLPVEPLLFSFNSPAGACATCLGLGKLPAKGETEPEPVCPDCAGSRLSTLSRAVKWACVNLAEICGWTVHEAANWFAERSSPDQLSEANEEGRLAVERLLPEIQLRLKGLRQIGLGYLTLDRAADSLSGGEHQRARLVASLSQGLTGVCYVLDEPTAGLHASDAARLHEILRALRDAGNTLVIVEHDLTTIRAADWVIELGPGAGPMGGQLVAEGSPLELSWNPASITGPYLKESNSKRPDTKPFVPSSWLTLADCTRHNLKRVTVEIPLGGLTCVTGVSGSGKSSLILESLVPAVRQALHPHASRVNEQFPWGTLTGQELLQRVVQVDQRPLGRSARSTPATFTGIWDLVRQLLVRAKEAKLRGFTARRFSLGEPSGRCPTCKGLGEIAIDLDFLPDLKTICPDCEGQRFNRATLAVKFKEHSAAELLRLTCEEARDLFANLARIREPLDLLCQLGLGYLQLGQSALELSGGEAQRIKLATELSRGAANFGDGNSRTLFVLDEPTSGLHSRDIGFLLTSLRRLVNQGHTVIVIEHHPHLLREADWEIQLGPQAGPAGGTIVRAGAVISAE